MKCMRKKPEFNAEHLDDILGRIINNSISDSEQIQEIAPELNYLIEKEFVFYSDGANNNPQSESLTLDTDTSVVEASPNLNGNA